jgi:hypothetical protein
MGQFSSILYCSTMYIHSILSGFSSTFCYQEPYTLECKGNSQPLYYGLVRVMAFNAIFNNISVILWWSVLLMEETGVPRENHRPVASRWQTLSHNVVSSTPYQFLRLFVINIIIDHWHWFIHYHCFTHRNVAGKIFSL